MTATTGSETDPHPEVSEISDLTEGLLPPERADEVREHIADCSLCTDVLDSLLEIRGLLGTLPGPQRMPADIAGRIDAALAAEALLDATLPGQRVPRGTSSMASVPRETSPLTRLEPRDRRWRGRLLVAASVAAVALLTGALYEAVHSGGGSINQDSASSASSAKKADGRAVDDPVADQVRQLLAAPAPGTAAPFGKGSDSPMLSGPSGTGSGGQGAAALPSCVLRGTQRSQPPVAAERYLFRGTDSYLVLLPHPGDTSRVDAYVVDASCTASSPGTLLFRGSYPR
ncbi:anti-sigma factor family protein [Streptomyces polygonati]|uniref:Anti-sigma factor family protein n=1 Tax=Streptomyces polygonati TaxID=1617087 RepID=A0ABV8HTC4_9ACTN